MSVGTGNVSQYLIQWLMIPNGNHLVWGLLIMTKSTKNSLKTTKTTQTTKTTKTTNPVKIDLVKDLSKYGDCELFRWFGLEGYTVSEVYDFTVQVLGRTPSYPTVQTQVSVGRGAGEDRQTKRGPVPVLPKELEKVLKTRFTQFVDSQKKTTKSTK